MLTGSANQRHTKFNVQILGIFAFGIVLNLKHTVQKCLNSIKLIGVYGMKKHKVLNLLICINGCTKQYLGNRDDWDTEEKCFSIDKDDAIRNIWDYGVFNSDGSKYKMDNQSFPIRTSVKVDEKTKRVHGYASYWGVHVDHEYQPYITETTEWVRDDWRQDSSETNQDKYTLKVKTIEVDKREKSFSSLNSLDGAGFRFWVNDSWWSDEYQKLGFPKVEPWEGKIQLKTSKATFTDYNNGNSSEPLTYGMYDSHDGTRTYVADLVGAKIDKDNIRKIIKNDSSDPGKAMDLTMEFGEFHIMNMTLMVGQETHGQGFIFAIKSLIFQQKTTSMMGSSWTYKFCLKVEGNVDLSSDGTTLTLSSTPKTVEVMVGIMSSI